MSIDRQIAQLGNQYALILKRIQQLEAIKQEDVLTKAQYSELSNLYFQRDTSLSALNKLNRVRGNLNRINSRRDVNKDALTRTQKLLNATTPSISSIAISNASNSHAKQTAADQIAQATIVIASLNDSLANDNKELNDMSLRGAPLFQVNKLTESISNKQAYINKLIADTEQLKEKYGL